MPHLYLSAPVVCSCELTFECNNACLGCPNIPNTDTTHPDADVLSYLDWKWILDSLPGIQLLKVTGGEPTLHPEFFAIIQEIESRAIPFTLFSNARWAIPGQVIDLLSSSAYCESVLISLHGADSKSHERFTRILGSFDETTRNARRAAQAGVFIAVSCVITEHNVDKLEDVVSLSNEIGAKAVLFNRYLTPNRNSSEKVGALTKAISAVENLRKTSSLPIRWGNCIPQCFEFSSSIGCHAGITHFTIDPMGNVRPCNHAPLVCGNILDQSIDEIWHGSQMDHWRQLVPADCYRCVMVEQCHGGCRAMQLIAETSTDPLMSAPIMPDDSPIGQEVIELPASARPKLCCMIGHEPFGLALISRGRFVPVDPAAQTLLGALDGSTTLEQIKNDYGESALNLVASLLKQGLVELG